MQFFSLDCLNIEMHYQQPIEMNKLTSKYLVTNNEFRSLPVCSHLMGLIVPPSTPAEIFHPTHSTQTKMFPLRATPRGSAHTSVEPTLHSTCKHMHFACNICIAN